MQRMPLFHNLTLNSVWCNQFKADHPSGIRYHSVSNIYHETLSGDVLIKEIVFFVVRLATVQESIIYAKW